MDHYDPQAGKIGMWLFLFTEALLFGTMFIVYAVYLHRFRWEFRAASVELDRPIGAINTVILLTSSLTMACAISALARGLKRQSLLLAGATVALAAMFLAIKSYEWGHKFTHQLYPNSAAMAARPAGEQMFFALYFVMTGLHGLHVAAGAAAILVAMRLVGANRVRADRPAFLENVGLYWHLVDVIWIFLFPLFYLIRY